MWKQNHRKIIPGGKNLAICNLIGFRNFYYCNLECTSTPTPTPNPNPNPTPTSAFSIALSAFSARAC